MSDARKRPVPQRQIQNLHFIKLADLGKHENKSVNVFGIVKFFKSPTKSKGRDYCLTLSLVDDSFQSTEQSFVCNIFSPHEDQLPLIRSVGDFVQLQGIRVSKFMGDLQGIGTSFLQWVTFDGICSDPITPSGSKIPNYTITEQDKQILKDLKIWASSYESIQSQFYKKTLSQIHSDVVFFNLVCQVISVCQAVNSNCLVLSVWDGTTPNCQSYSLEQLLASTLKVSASLKDETGNGMAIDVFLYDEHSSGEGKDLKPGDFVLLNNIHALPEKLLSKAGFPPIMPFVIHKGRVNGRGVRKLPPDSHFVRELQEQIDSFKASKHINRPLGAGSHSNADQAAASSRALQTSCTITDFPLVPFTDINKIKKYTKVPNKFRCRAKAVAFLPNNVRYFIQACCQGCKKVSCLGGSIEGNVRKRKLQDTASSDIGSESTDSKSESSQDEGPSNVDVDELVHQEISPSKENVCSSCNKRMTLVYIFTLLLEDTTGLLLVTLFDDDAKSFLSELPTHEEFLVNPEAQQSVRDSLVSITENPTNDLTTDGQLFQKKPWIECCVKSYFVEGQGVVYRMFATSLV